MNLLTAFIQHCTDQKRSKSTAHALREPVSSVT